VKAYICEECGNTIRVGDIMLPLKERFYLEINGMHFCSWKCVGKFALKEGDMRNEENI